MEKKRKRRKRKEKNQIKDLSISALEHKAHEGLAAKKFRIAKNYYKALCEHDREKYFPLLIEAYLGLALQMIDQGQINEAKVVLKLLKKLTDSCESKYLEMILAMKEKDYSAAADFALEYLSQTKDAPGAKGQEIADALVLAFKEIEFPVSIDPTLNVDLSSVHAALMLTSQEQYDKALIALRPIGIRSIFAHWKLFIKGLCSFYKGENEKTQKAFNGLPPKSLLTRAAEPYLIMLGGSAILEKYYKKADVLERLCRLTGKEEYIDVLPRAEYLWRIGRLRDSYRHVRNTLEEFPSEKTGIAYTLSVFYFNSLFHMEAGRAEKYLEFFVDISSANGCKNPTEGLMMHRSEGLYLEKRSYHDSDLAEVWENFLSFYDKIHGEDPNLKAILYAHMGDIFSEEIEDESGFFPLFSRRRASNCCSLRNETLADQYYHKSLKYNSDDIEVHLSILNLFEKTKKKARVNKKLDEIIRLFPEDKDALVKAGAGCIKRNAFQKAMKYLERAIQLDPIDAEVREYFEIACIKASLNYAKKSNVDRYRELLAKALANGLPNSDDFNRGHAYLYSRWAGFELLNDNAEETEKMMALASNATEKGLRLTYFFLLISRFYGVHKEFLKQRENQIKQEFSKKHSPEKAVIFADVISYFWNFSPLEWLHNETRRVNTYAHRAAVQDCSREQGRIIVEFALSEQNSEQKLAERYTAKMLKKNPKDPLFLYYRLEARSTFGYSYHYSRKEIEELRDILSLAEQEKDIELIAKIRKAIDIVESMPPFFEDPDLMDDIGLEEDYDDEGFDDMDFEDNLLNEMFDLIDSAFFRKGKRKKNRKKKVGGTPPDDGQLDLFE